MVSVTPTTLPLVVLAKFKQEDREPISGGETTWMGELSRLSRLGNPGRRDNFSSYKHFDPANWSNSRRAECYVMSRKWTQQHPFWSHDRGKWKGRGIFHNWLFKNGYDLSINVNFDSVYRDNIFTYERSIKITQGEGCLEYPTPCK